MIKKTLMQVDELRKRIFRTDFTYRGSSLNTIRPVDPKIARKLREPLDYREKREKEKSVSRVMSKLTIFSLFSMMLSLCFVFADISFYKGEISSSLVGHSVISIVLVIVTFALYVFWGISFCYENGEKYIRELEEMYAKSLQGKVFQVQKEMEVNGKDFATAVQRDSGIVAELAMALDKAEADLRRMKKYYNFLAKISFSKNKETYY